MGLSVKELNVIQNTEFLLTKRMALKKIREMLNITQSTLADLIETKAMRLPEKTDFSKWKISQGENYSGLPWMVLDYPAKFTKSNTFAFRTMFWWGNFFSVTLHLEGVYLDHYKKLIQANFDYLLNNNIYISVGKTPWEYHYKSDNYQKLSIKHLHTLNDIRFLKLSKKIELTDWMKVPVYSAKFFEFLLQPAPEKC